MSRGEGNTYMSSFNIMWANVVVT